MTQLELKNLDKRLRSIPDPLGSGSPSVQKVFYEVSLIKKTTMYQLMMEYCKWKISHFDNYTRAKDIRKIN